MARKKNKNDFDIDVLKCTCKKERANFKTSTKSSVQGDDCVCHNFGPGGTLLERDEDSRRKVGRVVLQSEI